MLRIRPGTKQLPQISRPKKILAVLALSLLLWNTGCQTPDGVEPSPAASSFPQVEGTPPPIPDFPSQGPLPTPMPRNNNAFADGAAVEELAADASAGGGGGESAAKRATSSADEAPAVRPVAEAPSAAEPAAPPADGDLAIAPELPPQPQPQAGLLTAGEWDDLSHWDFWLDLLNDQNWSGMPTIWGINTTQRVPVVVTGPEGRLADVPLELLDAQDQVLFQARTNTNGTAELFAALSSQQQAAAVKVRLNLGEASQEQDISLPFAASEPLQFELQQSLKPAVHADLMLSIDTTGSMGDELEYLKSELKNVAQRISAQNTQELTLRLSANFYRDTTDEYVVRSFPFTEDANAVAQQLSEQSANGGGDFPEAVDVALADAVDEHVWSPTARARLLFLVLDAPPHKDENNLKRLHTSLTRAAAKGIRIIPVASSGIDKETEFLLRMMAQATGGRYVFLTDDSGIGSSHLKPTVGQYDVEKLNDLMVRIASEYIAGTVNTSPALAPPQNNANQTQQSQE